MKIFLNYKAFILTSFMFIACNTKEGIDIDTKMTGHAGKLDLSKYVSIGNSLTAGLTDAALSPSGQSSSFPVILSKQFSIVGGGSFFYPDISSGNGFGGQDANGNLLGKSFIDLAAAATAIAMEGSFADVIRFKSGSVLNLSSKTGSSLNNFGVPGAKVIDLETPGYGVANPYYRAFQSSETSSILTDAVSANPTFYTMWIGSNDVLGYALAGGSAGKKFDPSNPSTITDIGTFSTKFSKSLDAMGTTDGVVITIPPITIIPFFKIVTQLSGGINILPASSFSNSSIVTFLNSHYATTYNASLGVAVRRNLINEADSAFRAIQFTTGVANAPVITDESLSVLNIGTPESPILLPQIRQAKMLPTGQSDLFPITVISVIGTLANPNDPTSIYGIGKPLPDASTLTMDEQVNVIKAYAGFNMEIEAQAKARDNITLVDIRPLFADLYGLSPEQAKGLSLGEDAERTADRTMGYTFEGTTYFPLELLNTANIYNSVWSTDGVHPNPRGAALLVNEIIKKLNEVFDADIPLTNPLDYAPINAPL